MRRNQFTLWTSIFAVTFLAADHLLARAGASEDEEPASSAQRPTLRAAPLSPDFRLDGRMTDRDWMAAPDSIANLTTVEPEEGGVPADRTIVKVLADAEAIVIGVRCYDSEPGHLVSYSKARDSALDEEDHIVIVLDPFMDARSGYVFAVNPSGARFDGLVAARGEDVNSDWDAVWEAKTAREEDGWSAEIRIPIASLTFKKGLPAWGLNVQRRVPHRQETSRWSGINLDYEIYQTSRAGRLTDLPVFDLGVGLSVRPAVVSTATTPAPKTETDIDNDVSFDATQRLGANFLSSLTVNTDFSETEVDVRQVNLTRFPISFPEKRTFFLSGADIFEFGLGLDQETLIPFYTRRIGLVADPAAAIPNEEDQSQVPIDVGGKIGGRIGESNIGALVVNTRKMDGLPVGDPPHPINVPDATMGAVRLKQNILEESAVGLMGTFGDQLGRNDSWTAGLDFTYQTSSFRGEQNLLFGLWGLSNHREDLKGDKTAYGARLAYPNDLWDVSLTTMRIGDGFDPSMGFVPRKGVQLVDAVAEFAPRPGWPFLRQMFHEVSYSQYTNRQTDRWESYNLTLKPLDWLFESGDRIEASAEPQGDRPPKEFEVAPDIDIAPGSYEWTRYILAARSAERRKISVEIRSETGEYYTGNLETREARLTLKPSALLFLEFTGERNRGVVWGPDNGVGLYERKISQDLMGCRFQLNVSPDLQLSSFTQYDTESREMGSNNRLRWTFNPQGDVFIVYNHNWHRQLNKSWTFISNQLPVKIQFAWRF